MVHVIASVGWLGAVGCLVVLTITGHLAAVVTLQAHLIPALAIITLLTGMVLSLGTQWGLVRHWWVMIKVVLAVAVVVGGVALTGPHAAGAVTAGVAESPRVMASSAGHLVALAVATGLSVIKPRGRPPWASGR